MKFDILDGRFSFRGASFVIDTSAGYKRRPSDAEAFTLVKTQQFLQFYAELSGHTKPRGILELGVFQGGSYVFLDKMFAPERMSAIEISKVPVQPLVDHVAATPGRSVHFGTSQADADALRRVVAEDLGGMLDMVVDDASHDYTLTRTSFEVLFPLLAPGGLYIIEDWAWAHQPLYQPQGAPRHEDPALTNLLFEHVMLLASSPKIAEIRIRKPLYVIRKSAQAVAEGDGDNVWADLKLRGKPLPAI